MLFVEHQYLPDSTSLVPVAPDELSAPNIVLGFMAWNAARGQRRFPERIRIRPRDIAPALQHMALLKAEAGDFVFRIVGDGIVRAYDLSMQNRSLGDIVFDEPSFDKTVVSPVKQTVETRAPLALYGTIGHDAMTANFTDFETLFLPLGPDDATIDHIMMFAHFSSKPYLPKRIAS